MSRDHDVEISQRVECWAGGEGVIVTSVTPTIADALEEVGLAVAVGVHEARQLALLRDINLIVDDA